MTRWRIKTNVTLYEKHIDIVDDIGAESRAAGVREIIERSVKNETALRDCIGAANKERARCAGIASAMGSDDIAAAILGGEIDE